MRYASQYCQMSTYLYFPSIRYDFFFITFRYSFVTVKMCLSSLQSSKSFSTRFFFFFFNLIDDKCQQIFSFALHAFLFCRLFPVYPTVAGCEMKITNCFLFIRIWIGIFFFGRALLVTRVVHSRPLWNQTIFMCANNTYTKFT